MTTVGTATSNFTTMELGLLPDLSPGVASLDTPQVRQTKLEIRTLVAEIAELSNRKIAPIEFYRGMLPRVCAAMGATGACVWSVAGQSSFSIVAAHCLPSALTAKDYQPSDLHRRILECVFVEDQPVLVPPGSITLEVQRPTNPLDEALLIVPVRLDNNVDFLLEIVQRPGGGPVAQRGYLRFVAQMADLMADYLRREALRSFTCQQEYATRFHDALITLAGCNSDKQRFRVLAAILDGLLDVRQAILLKGFSRYRVQAISGIELPDPRSETVVLASRVANNLATAFTDSREFNEVVSATALSDFASRRLLLQICPHSFDSVPAWREPEQVAAKQLSDLLGAERLFALSLSSDRSIVALLPCADEPPPQHFVSRAKELATAFAPLFERPESFLARFLLKLNFQANSPKSHRNAELYAIVQRWSLRIATIFLAVVIAAFPVPQQVSVTALLEPAQKQTYYAPTSALVNAVHVDQDSRVKSGDLLLELIDQQLQAQLDQVLGRQSEARSQIGQIQSTLNRNAQLPSLQRDQLEGEKMQLTIAALSLDAQHRILQRQLSDLKIVARQEGVVATWDIRNRLVARPVQAGQLLLTVFQPDGPWRLQLSIPDYRVGLVSQAIASNPAGAKVKFSLSSHPGEVREGRVKQLGSQAVQGSNGQRVVLASTEIESASLPIKKDGTIARATIDCGQVPAIWLILRDAIWAITTRLKMIW